MTDRIYQEQEDHIADCYALLNEQKAEIARLTAALEFYANEKTITLMDRGEIARKALDK